MRKHWWKVLCVLILLYVMIVGLLAPLATGIVKVTPISSLTDTTFTITSTGYNSHYQTAEEGQTAYLVLDQDYALCAKKLDVINDNQLQATFDIPRHLPIVKSIASATLVINNTIDGSSLLPDAISIVQKQANDTIIGQQNWATCDLQLTDNEQYDFPYRNLLSETIRNTYFHVPLWFGMMIIFLVSMIYSIQYLRTYDTKYDLKSLAFVRVGTLFGILGIVTGAIWAKYTWGQFWSFDIKQNMSAVAILIYLAYFVLRGSFEDEQARARLSSIYNIFSFATLIPLLYVIPRLYDSLHPGNGGNPGFGGEDLDNTMRTIFYPAIIGWTLLGVWMANLVGRIDLLKEKWLDQEE